MFAAIRAVKDSGVATLIAATDAEGIVLDDELGLPGKIRPATTAAICAATSSVFVGINPRWEENGFRSEEAVGLVEEEATTGFVFCIPLWRRLCCSTDCNGERTEDGEARDEDRVPPALLLLLLLLLFMENKEFPNGSADEDEETNPLPIKLGVELVELKSKLPCEVVKSKLPEKTKLDEPRGRFNDDSIGSTGFTVLVNRLLVLLLVWIKFRTDDVLGGGFVQLIVEFLFGTLL
jgi:hypothetical protein